MPGLVLNFALMRNSQLIANLKRRAYIRRNPTNRTNTKNQRITIIAGQEYPTIIEAKAKSAQLNISAYVHRCLEYYDDEAPKPLLISYKKDIVSQDHQLTVKDEQLATKDQQIEGLQSTLDQSPQLQALTESRYQAEHQ